MNLSHLYYFQKLAEVQHYTRAAESLFITQPTLSNAIAQLEKELGVPLFEKSGRNIRLTKQGMEFNSYVSQALALLEKGKAVALEQSGLSSGTFDLGVVYTIQDSYLPRLMQAFRNKYENIHVNTFQGLTASLVEDLVAGRYDVVFSSYQENYDDCEFYPVLSQRLVVLMHEENPLAKRDAVDLADLRDCKVYTYRDNSPIGQEVKRAVAFYCSEPLNLNGRAEDEITLGSFVDSDDNSVGLTLDTLGLLPFTGLVRRPLLGVPDDFHTVYMVHRKNAFLPRCVENFIDFVKTFDV